MNAEEATARVAAYGPLLVDAVPLTLEEILFMSWEVRIMQSKTLCFNGTLFRRNLTRFWPLWLLYAAIWLLMGPVGLFVEIYGRYARNINAENLFNNVRSQLLDISANGGLIMGAIFGVLFAMALYSYLTTARSWHVPQLPRSAGESVSHQLSFRRGGVHGRAGGDGGAVGRVAGRGAWRMGRCWASSSCARGARCCFSIPSACSAPCSPARFWPSPCFTGC